ncbi:MAG: LuxR C-terminal-related transcriptional regulator, partial [Raoultibacter sp.]
SPYLPSTPSLSNFTTRERDVAMLVAEGFTNEQIASNLCISLSTVKSHLQNIFSKAQVTNRTTLVALLHGYTH